MKGMIEMKVLVLVLHIIATILSGALAVISANITSEILWMVSSVLSGVLVGMDIKNLLS